MYGLLFIWFESFPLVFGGIYGFNLGLQGVAFLGIFVEALFAIPPFVWYVRAVQEKQFNENGEIRPENRLSPAMVGAFCIPICLLWFGLVGVRGQVFTGSCPYSAPASSVLGLFCSSLVCLRWPTQFMLPWLTIFQNSVLNYLPDAYPDDVASVLAGNAFMRFSFGAAFPLFAPATYHTLGIAWSSTLLAFLGCLFVPIPYAFYFLSIFQLVFYDVLLTISFQYGGGLRGVSKRARKGF